MYQPLTTYCNTSISDKRTATVIQQVSRHERTAP